MSNNLRQAKKDLKAFAKRAKDVKYTESLLFSYLITGMITFSIGLNTSSNVLYERMNKELVMSADKTRTAIKKKKKANEEAVEELNLELVQLMEQGDQVVKSPWSSWQFGANTFISSSNGTYKGRGDKAEKYLFNGIYNRGNWSETGILSNRRKSYMTSSPGNSTIGKQSYGLASLLHVQEPEVEIQIMANVRPKSVFKEEIAINPQIDMPREVVRPNINLNVTSPITAPTIILPTLNPVTIEVPNPQEPATPATVTAPSISMNLSAPTIAVNITPPSLSMNVTAPTPTVNTLTIIPPDISEVSAISVTKPTAPSVTPPNPTANPIVFSIPQLESYGNTITADNTMNSNKNLLDPSYRLSKAASGHHKAIGEYMTNSGYFYSGENTEMHVDITKQRAITLDPGLPQIKGGGHNPNYSFENKGKIYLEVMEVAGIEVQPDTWNNPQVTGINGSTGLISGNKSLQVALLFTDEGTGSSTTNKHTLRNEGEISLSGNISAGFATSDFKSGVSVSTIAINNGNVNISGDNSHGMVVSKTTNALGPDSSFVNNGTIKVTGNDSGGMTVLGKIQGGATNNGIITIAAKNSFGLYSQVDSNVKNAVNGNINIENGSKGSMGIRVGNASATNMKNEGTITINSTDGKNIGVYSSSAKFVNEGKIKVNGANENIGMYFNGTTGTTGNQGTITVAGNKVYGVILNNATFENEKKIEVTSDGTDSIGLYLSNGSAATNKNGATISNAAYHAVVQNTGTFTNAGVVSVEAGGKVGLYSENGTFTNASNGEIKSSNGGIAIFTSGSTGTVEGTVTVGDSGTSTGIGVYSDGPTTSTTFQGNAVLSLGERTVGLYSSKASNFGTAFTITNLSTSIGKKSVFAYFGNTGNTADDTVDITNTTLQNLTVSSMGENSAVFYGAKNTTINIDGNITADSTKFSNINDSAQFLVSDDGKVNINSSKILTSGFKTTISGLNGAVVTNDGKLILSGKDGAIGIYSNASKVTNNNIISTANNSSIAIYGKESSTLTNSGTGKITTSGTSSVGILANSSIVSNATGGEITTSGTGSAGIYGITNSTIENSGNITTEETGSAGIYADNSDVTNETTGKITSKKGSSAGIYSTSTSAKNVKNKGTIEVGVAGSTETQNVGIYAEGNQNVENDGNINIHIGNSIGVYGKGANVAIENKKKITSDALASDAIGIMSEKAKVTNFAGSEIKLQGKKSVGIYGKESEIENSGDILLTDTTAASASVGILANKGSATNKGNIEMNGGASAGMLGLNGATISNDAATGKITITGDKSAGIYVENSSPSNAGTISVESNKSAGIFAKISDAASRTITNTGKIELKGTGKTKSAGMYVEIESTAAGTTTLQNEKDIIVGQEESAAMYLKNNAGEGAGTVINETPNGKIDLDVKSTVGIFVDKAKGKNKNIINVKKENSAGMYGSNDSNITNEKTINVSHENSAGMYASDSNATNTADGTITLTGSAGATSGSAAMYGKLTSSSKKDYSILNEGIINLTNVIKNVGIYGESVSGAPKKLTLQNNKEINIAAGSPQSVGIFASNDANNNADKIEAINSATGTITVNSEESIGISAVKSTVNNSGTITMNDKKSAGIYGKSGSEVTNNNKIEIKEEQSAGIYLENSNAVNAAAGTIDVYKGASAGIYGKFTKDATENNTIENSGTITLKDTAGQVKSAGIYGELEAAASKTLTIENKNIIDVSMKESVGIFAKNATGSRGNLTADNTGEIKVNSEKSVGMLSDNSVINNKNKITVNNKEAVGMYGKNGSEIKNHKGATIEILSTGESAIGIYATGKNTTTSNITEGVNEGTVTVKGKKGTGMLATDKAKITNNREITGTAESVIGMYGVDDETAVINAKNATIKLTGEKSTGIFSKDDATAENSGTINLTSSSKNSVGMFGSASAAGKKITLTNTADGVINVESESSTGMFTKNNGNLADSTIKNEGTINLKQKSTVGIYTPKSNITKVGTIILNDDADSSVAVYLKDEATVTDTTTGTINLGTKNQNRVAYYIKGTSASDTGKINGANIGNISGYGVGVYLDGGILNSSTSKLDYTTGSNTGNGIIGLLMKGATADISGYNQGIKVGNSVLGGSNDFYAIGIYTDGQGSSGSPKAISTSITAGANGVGLFAENSSHIKYAGTMNIGDNTTAGTGIYIGNGGDGTKASTVTIDSGADIKLNGVNGVGAIVTTNATVNFETGAKIQFGGDGVGIFGQKGAVINDNGGTLVTNGHSVERTRVTEGSSVTSSDLTVALGNALDTGNILSHVINGEAILQTGVTVEAKSATKNIIGLMADGNSNPALTWVGTAGYDAENKGKLDLSNAQTSTAMYLDSARGLNSKDILVGNKSTGIYGIYKNTTAGYIGAPAGFKNEGIITTTAGSKITIGDESSAIYSIGFDKVENNGSIAGGDKSVGIYAKNTAASSKNIDVVNTGDITLGKGSAGIYIAPETANASNATVVNSGNITVGDSTLDASGNVESTSVGIFVRNKTNLTTTGDVTVGNKGFALYGNDSTLTVNGGNYNFANNGSLAYLENNAMLNYNNAGTLTTSSEPMLYIINSKAQMNNNDIIVSSKGTGIYMTGTSAFGGWNNMILNNGSTGIYVDNSNAAIDGKKITGTSDKAKGIVSINSNVMNKADMEFSSDDSIGIFSQNKSGVAKSILNNGNIDITGKRSIAAYLEGTSDQTFENSGTINVDRTATSVKNDSTVGIYAQNGSTINIKNSGTINVGEASFGVYSLSENGNVETAGSSIINVADKAIGVYKKGGSVNLGGTVNVANHIAADANSEPVGVYGTSGVTINDTTANFTVGDKSYGVILSNPGMSRTNVYSNSASSNVTLGKEATFIYAEGASRVTNNAAITSGTNGKIIAIYGKDGANIVNNGMIDLSQGLGNQGILVTGASNAVNRGVIKVGKTDKTDPDNIIYGIGMAAVGGASISNERDIHVRGNLSIGMYGDDRGTILRNSGNIYLDPSSATASDKVQTMMGVFVNNGAKFVNTGNITTTGSYHGNDNIQGLVGVAVLNGSTLENYGKIDIDADSSYGVLIKGTSSNKSIIKNYGEINISGLKSYGVRYDADSQGVSGDLPVGTAATPVNVLPSLSSGTGTITSANGAKDYYAPTDPSKTLGGVGIVQLPNGRLAIQRNGVTLDDSQVQTIDYATPQTNYAFSNFGVYVDTLGRTRPINVNGANSIGINSDLLIGTEFSVLTNAKDVIIGKQILQPFLNQINAGIFNFTPYSASLTWMATPEVDPSTQQITRVLMTKIPYTAFVSTTSNEFNFTDGLEQRYDVNSLDSREKGLFNKLNTIGNSEEALLAQSIDEMMGHQYGNVQQRIFETGNLLNKEFGYLRNEWDTKSKNSNKIKAFGMKGEYKTDTAGIIDYKNKSYGFAYLNENETIKLGESAGWYAGAVRNKFDFSDIGGSKEEQNIVKAGIFKSMPLGKDHNNNLNWTVSAEGFVGTGEMKRKFLVVDDIFEAKSEYHSYGFGLKNELRKNIRTSERTSISPYGSLKFEYGRFDGIKEDTGQMRLEIKANDYYSIKPEIGVEFKYQQPMAVKTNFVAKLGLAYENELGKVGDVNNQGRVRYTTAGWFDIRGEKDDRRGNGKADLNLGIENTRFGVTVNAGYDTKGENVRGGIGFRVIY
ncbi:autotransporter beta- domain-containing protein [Leptotrichia shahii]|uniref:Autotransporter beta-domain-containing protein n=1 Tax=Leptotrichia shahii TaxID=157691 RepID=A0A510JM03_9FUSO|nr:autotransporter-associated N-terminal domain-containing protein [Leptotrichia shahii]BBM40284.1 autotransporter beta- domain-containing protein [Leptotrichia shahii]